MVIKAFRFSFRTPSYAYLVHRAIEDDLASRFGLVGVVFVRNSQTEVVEGSEEAIENFSKALEEMKSSFDYEDLSQETIEKIRKEFEFTEVAPPGISLRELLSGKFEAELGRVAGFWH